MNKWQGGICLVIYFVFLTSPSPIYFKIGAFRQNKTKLGLLQDPDSLGLKKIKDSP